MRTIQQPGPIAETRHLVGKTNAVEIDINLDAGDEILTAVAQKFASENIRSAYLYLTGATVDQLEFVMPAPSPDNDHVAWYSRSYNLKGGGSVDHAGLVFGWRDGAPFIHCHGLWRDEDGTSFAGHMLPEKTRLNEPTTLNGWAFSDASFEGIFDAETNFTLFQPHQNNLIDESNAAIIRLRPNVEVGQEVLKICKSLGWAKANLHGIGSLVGAQFADGQQLESYATEFLLKSGAIDLDSSDEKAALDILIVGIDGHIMSGLLQKDENAVLMTCEFLLLKN